MTISDVPGTINARVLARNSGSTVIRPASAFRSGAAPPTLVTDSQSRRPLASTVSKAENACEPETPSSPPTGARPISTPFR